MSGGNARARAMPPLMYGTAWKEDRTGTLVRAALDAGFRGIDTANQRKHYHEAGVGAALRGAFAAGVVQRADLFLQTKFTFARGQDHRLPYDPAAPITEQVARSFASSLDHLGVDALDALVLHGPSVARGLAKDDWDAWSAMEALQRAGRVRAIGVSNVSFEQLKLLHESASVKPSIVQDRTLVAGARADAATRAFCREHEIAYQGFSLLTAAPQLLAHPAVRAAAARAGLTPAATLLRFWTQQGVVVLTGTTDAAHMADDLRALDAELTRDELGAISALFG